MGINDFVNNYSAVGDIITIILCVIFVILLRSTYTVKHKTLTLFYACTSMVCIASVSSIKYHVLLRTVSLSNIRSIYFYSAVCNISLLTTFMMFCLYLEMIVNMSRIHRHLFNTLAGLCLIVYTIMEIVAPYTHMGLYIDHNLQVYSKAFVNTFTYGYLFYSVLICSIIYVYRKRFITKVRYCIQRIMLLSFSLMMLQFIFGHSSFISITFLFPILAGLFLFHYNAYDSGTGTLDIRSLFAYLNELKSERYAMIFMNLKRLSDKDMQNLSEDFFHFDEKFFTDACTFRINETKLVMVYTKKKNPDEDFIFKKLLEDFYVLFDKHKIPFKLVKIDSNSELDKPSKYLDLDNQIEGDMKWDSVHICDEYDLKKFTRNAFVYKVLSDIIEEKDLDDDRVKVYCQPVLNTRTGEFSTAEALMRIVVPGYGMIFPDEFIPIAEKYEYIHTLSRIILNKTCKHIIELEAKGYYVDRVSVNFSIIELRNDNFCDDIMDIIKNTGVGYDRIAIELTESKNEQDYERVKAVVAKLHEKGIKFYLDDFGTGYSNFERIMGLPIDIIKFDRSLTAMASRDENKSRMVGSFADIFYNASYQILFEGVENDEDEVLCKEMKAVYLQGYKYSKPIPMEELSGFLRRA